MGTLRGSRACSSGVSSRMASWYSSRLSKDVARCRWPPASLRSFCRAERARMANSRAGDSRARAGTSMPKARPDESNMSSQGATWPR